MVVVTKNFAVYECETNVYYFYVQKNKRRKEEEERGKCKIIMHSVNASSKFFNSKF